MDFDLYKGYLQDFVERNTTRSKKAGKRMYVCPLCKSGTGKNGTGAFSLTADGEQWHCFTCDKGGDIYDLYQEIHHCTRAEAFIEIEKLYGVSSDFKPCREFNSLEQEQDKQEKLAKLEKIHKDIREAQEHLQEILDSTGNYRGVSEATLRANNVGYIEKWSAYGSSYTSARVIIPTSNNSYVARATDPTTSKEYKCMKQGSVHMLQPKGTTPNGTEPVFVVEGEMDALSIQDNGGNAIALGSTSGVNSFLEEIDKQSDFAAPLILALDNDEAGRKATTRLKLELEARNIKYTTLNWQPVKDANDLLQSNKQEFVTRIEGAVRTAREVSRDSLPTCYVTTEEEARELREQGKRAVTLAELETACMLETEQTHNIKTLIDRLNTPDSRKIINSIAEENGAGIITNATEEIEELERQVYQAQERKADKEEEYINSHSGASILVDLERNRNTAKKPLMTGIEGLDKALGGGIYDGGLYVLGGTTGSGKSNLAIQIADGIAENGQREADGTVIHRDILYFSLEMSKEEIVARTLARICNTIKGTYEADPHTIDPSKQPITTRDILDHDRYRWKNAEGLKNEGVYQQALQSYASRIQGQIYYYDSTDNINAKEEYKGAFTVKDILEIAKKHEDKKGQAPIIFIDYLQLLASNEYKDERSKTKDGILALKEYCMDTKSIVFVITSFSRANYNREADIDSGKEAGEIEYTANVFIGLSLECMENADTNWQTPQQQRKEAEQKNPREMKVAILKNRYGTTTDLFFEFYPASNKWKFVLNKNDKKQWEEHEQAEEASHKTQIKCNKKPTKRQIKNFIQTYNLDINTDNIEEMNCIVWSKGILSCDLEELAKVKAKHAKVSEPNV